MAAGTGISFAPVELVSGCELDTQYYTKTSFCRSSRAALNVSGVHEISAQSLAFASSMTFAVSSQAVLQQMALRMVIDVPDGVGIIAGWGPQLIQRVQIVVGGSNIYSYEGASLVHYALANADTYAKRSQLVTNNSAGQFLPGNVGGGARRCEATVIIPSPFSDISEDRHGKGLDASLVNGVACQVQIFLQPAGSIMWVSSPSIQIPSQLAEAQLIFRELAWADATQSIRMDLVRQPNLLDSAPFCALQSQRVNFQGSTSTPVALAITGVRAGPLAGMVMTVVPTAGLSQSATAVKNPWRMTQIQNLLVECNGQPLFRARGSSAYAVLSANHFADTPTAAVQVYSAAMAQLLASSYEATFYVIPFSQNNPLRGFDYASVAREAANQTFNFSFTTEEDVQYTLFLTLYYSGNIFANGTAQLVY